MPCAVFLLHYNIIERDNKILTKDCDQSAENPVY